jgi:leucine dehydrogenase
MKVFPMIEGLDHEQIIYCYDKETGLKAIIALHDVTTYGRAMGATRLFPYKEESDAIKDVLRLSQGMTDKAACANIPVGGAKGVIIADPKDKTEELFKAYARFVNNLGGIFITGQDVNLETEDVLIMSQVTNYVVGVKEIDGGPSIATAKGVVLGIKAATMFLGQSKTLTGLRVAIQGLGNVGQLLCRYLYEEGVQLFVSDLDSNKTAFAQQNYHATVIPVEEIFDVEVDVFSPCALGGVINPVSIERIKASIIAGCANNQLENEYRDGHSLKEREILYCPDFVINAGGLINVYSELMNYNIEKIDYQIHGIYDTLLEIFNLSRLSNISTIEASRQIAKIRNMRSK